MTFPPLTLNGASNRDGSASADFLTAAQQLGMDIRGLNPLSQLQYVLANIQTQGPPVSSGWVFNITDPKYGWRPNASEATTRRAIQNTLDAAASVTLYRPKADGDVGADSYSSPVVLFPSGFFEIDDEIEVYAAAQIVGMCDTFLKQTDVTKGIFTGPITGGGYLTRISGINFIGGAQQIVLTRPNADTSMNLIEKCTFSTGDPTQFSVELELRSGLTVFRDCRVLSAPKFCTTTDCDMVVFQDCWWNGYDAETGKKPANTASFEFQCDAGTNSKIIFSGGGILVPESEVSATNANTRWIDLYDYVSLEAIGTQFGGENAGLPIVYNYCSAATPAGSPYTQSGGISLRGCQVSSGSSSRVDRGVVVLQTAVPPRIHIQSCYDLIDGYVINDQISGGAAAWLAGITDGQHPRISITIDGVTGSGSIPIGADVATVPTASTALNAYATVFDVQTVGGPNVFQVPVSKTPSGALSASGVTANTASNTFVTLFTPTVAGVYFVALIIPNTAAAYQGCAVVSFDGTTAALLRKDVGASVDFQLSGAAVQGKQTSGGASTMSWSYQYQRLS